MSRENRPPAGPHARPSEAPEGPGGRPAQDPVERLLEQLLARAEHDLEGALDRACSEHPEHAATLRRRVGLLGELGVLTPPAPGSGTGTDGTPTMPDRLGPFRLLRPLGTGGMGVVYLAEQEDLHRQVALKVVRPEQLYFPGARERFRREVETVARLQHPGIVPVYTVGDEGGVPYFAMELVEGCSLAEALDAVRATDARPDTLTGRDLAWAVAQRAGGPPDTEGWLFSGTWEQTCVRIVRQLADALEHAHQRGVVHRDLKPSNVMLTHGVAGGQVKLLDFGLASATGDASMTRSGSRVGSLPYMAPEQTRGQADAVGPRTDVYALGVTLYELITLSKPFAETGEAELLAAIQRGSARPMRTHNPAVSWEAETVCLTAMEIDPARRYATAVDLARDLGNVLEHRPIEARRASPTRRLSRWVQRNPMAALASALAFLLVVAAPLFFVWRERLASEAIRGELRRADAHFARSLDAIDRMLRRLGEEELRFVPQMELVRTAVLRDAIELTESLLADEPNDPLALARAAQSQKRLGQLLVQLGRYDDALVALERCLALQDRLLAEGPDDPGLRAGRASALGVLAEALTAAGRPDEAESLYTEADEEFAAVLAGADGADSATQAAAEFIAARRPGGHASDPLTWRRRRAENLTALATLRGKRYSREDADAFDVTTSVFEQALAITEELVERAPDDDRAQAQLGQSCSGLARHLLRRPSTAPGPEPRAHALIDRAGAAFDRAMELAPDEPSHRFEHLLVGINRANAFTREGDYQAAARESLATFTPFEELVRDFPHTPSYAIELATAYNQLGNLFDWAGGDAEAATWYAKSVELMHTLVARYPHLPELQSRLGIGEMNLGAKRGRLGEHEQACTHFEQAIVHQTRATELAPERGDYAASLRWHYQAHADGLLDLGDGAAAAEASEGMIVAMPDDWESYTRVGSQMARCVASLRAAGANPAQVGALVERAVAHLREALARGFPHPEELWTIPVLDPLRGSPSFDALLSELGAP